MKRVVTVLLVLVMMCGVALADEILFRGIPWGANIIDAESVIDAIPDCDIYYVDEYNMPYWEKHSALSIGLDASSDYNTGYMMAVMSMGWISPDAFQEFKVGGHTVEYMNLYFRFGLTDEGISRDKEDSVLILAEYDFDSLDYAGAYDDLKAKLTSLYGEGKETVEESEGMGWSEDGEFEKFGVVRRVTVWDGDNNTSVKLESSTSTLPVEDDMWNHYMNLAYGKTDEKKNIDLIDDYVKLENIKSEKESITADVSGL